MMLMPRQALIATACLTLCTLLTAGCQPKHAPYPTYQPSTQPLTDTGLSPRQRKDNVDAMVAPPIGWQTEETKSDEDHVHLSWKSRSGKTNYGVIYFNLPIPVPATWIINPYLDAMKKSEGEANVIEGPVEDKSLPGLRFTVECGDYRMRTNLICKGFHGWAIYAGSLRNQPESPEEIHLAERARDHTLVGPAAANTMATPTVTRPTASTAE